MAGTRLRRFPHPNPWPTVAYAITAAAILVTVLETGRGRLPGAVWAVLLLLLVIAGYAHSRFSSSWSRKIEKLVEAIKRTAVGADPWQAAGVAETSTNDIGDNVRLAIDDLSTTVRDLIAEKCRAELVLANMADGIMAVGPDTTVTLFNRAASALMGEKVSAVLGKRLTDVGLHPEITRIVDECLSVRGDVTAEIQLPGWPGRVVSLRATPFRSSGSRPDCAIVILHDLTEIRQHEKSQKEFVSNVGHELRTPLTAARVTAEALLSGAKNDEELLDRFLNTIIAEVDRLSALIDDLLEIVRISSGISSTEKADCRLRDIVIQATDPIRPLATAKNVTVDVSIGDGLSAYCDSAQMVQVVRNLVVNAVKYTPDGGHVSVNATETESHLVLNVEDTGIGIPQGEKNRVFERFYRVDKARSRRMGGTGLGLAIVKEIVESHGGEVCVETQLGRGSTFTVRLPRPVREEVRDLAGTHSETEE